MKHFLHLTACCFSDTLLKTKKSLKVIGQVLKSNTIDLEIKKLTKGVLYNDAGRQVKLQSTRVRRNNSLIVVFQSGSKKFNSLLPA